MSHIGAFWDYKHGDAPYLFWKRPNELFRFCLFGKACVDEVLILPLESKINLRRVKKWMALISIRKNRQKIHLDFFFYVCFYVFPKIHYLLYEITIEVSKFWTWASKSSYCNLQYGGSYTPYSSKDSLDLWNKVTEKGTRYFDFLWERLYIFLWAKIHLKSLFLAYILENSFSFYQISIASDIVC